MSWDRKQMIAVAVAVVAAVVYLVVPAEQRAERGPIISEPALTTAWTVEPDSPATITATFRAPDSEPNLTSSHIRITAARIGRRAAVVHQSATMLRAIVKAQRGFALGKRYGVELTYRDELNARTEHVRFPEVLRKEAVKICDAASPC